MKIKSEKATNRKFSFVFCNSPTGFQTLENTYKCEEIAVLAD